MLYGILQMRVGHPYHTKYVGPVGLRAPPEVAFAMRSWPLLLPTVPFLFLLRLLLLTNFRETPEAEILFLPIFWLNYRVSQKKLPLRFWGTFMFATRKVR